MLALNPILLVGNAGIVGFELGSFEKQAQWWGLGDMYSFWAYVVNNDIKRLGADEIVVVGGRRGKMRVA
jgi:hypothetical protein